MFVFDNVLTAGTVLVRQQIESQNWESSGHTSGWFIGADGSATFNNLNLRGDLQSANYVAATSGYKLTYATGAGEFNSTLTVNGGTITGALLRTAVTGNRVEVTTNPIFLLPAVNFYTGSSSFVSPGSLLSNAGPGVSNGYLELISPDEGHGQTAMFVKSPISATDSGGVSVTAPGAITVGAMRPIAGEAGNVSPTTTSLAFTNFGITATDVVIAYPPSGKVAVTVGAALSCSIAAPFGILSFEIRDQNAAGAVLLAASDNASMFVNGTGVIYSAERTFIATPAVPASGILFVRCMARVSAASTLTIQRPYCNVTPLL